MKRHLALFRSTRAVIRAERLCGANGIRCRIIPVPRTISSECGMAIEIDENEIGSVTSLCSREAIEVEFAVWERQQAGS